MVVSAFNLIDYNTFSVQISESSEEVRVSPFTSAGLRNQLSEELLNLGMSISDDPDLVFTLSIGFDSTLALVPQPLSTDDAAGDPLVPPSTSKAKGGEHRAP